MRPHLLLLFLPLIGACRAGELTFSEIPWGSDAAEVRQLMTFHGFRFVTEANHWGDHLYTGTYAGRSAIVVARMSGGGVAKFEVGIDPRDEDRPALFRALRERLEYEHGGRGRGRGVLRPVERTDEADGWRTAATPALRSVWASGGRGGTSYLILEDRADVALVIAFESPAWHAEFLRRQNARRSAGRTSTGEQSRATP